MNSNKAMVPKKTSKFTLLIKTVTHASMFSAGIPMVVDSGHSILLIIRCCQSWNNSLKEREYQINIQCRKPSSRESALNSFPRRTLSRLIFDWRCQSKTMPLTWQTDTRFMLPRTVELRCYKHSIAFMCHWEVCSNYNQRLFFGVGKSIYFMLAFAEGVSMK